MLILTAFCAPSSRSKLNFQYFAIFSHTLVIILLTYYKERNVRCYETAELGIVKYFTTAEEILSTLSFVTPSPLPHHFLPELQNYCPITTLLLEN